MTDTGCAGVPGLSGEFWKDRVSYVLCVYSVYSQCQTKQEPRREVDHQNYAVVMHHLVRQRCCGVGHKREGTAVQHIRRARQAAAILTVALVACVFQAVPAHATAGNDG